MAHSVTAKTFTAVNQYSQSIRSAPGKLYHACEDCIIIRPYVQLLHSPSPEPKSNCCHCKYGHRYAQTQYCWLQETHCRPLLIYGQGGLTKAEQSYPRTSRFTEEEFTERRNPGADDALPMRPTPALIRALNMHTCVTRPCGVSYLN